MGVGFAADVLNSLLLTAIDLNGDGSLAGGLPPTLVSFALGDFAGTVLVVPIMLALADQFGPERRPWPLLLAYGVTLVSPAVVLCLSLLPSIEAPIYPLALALLPLFLVAYRYGWRPAMISYGLLCLALTTATLPNVAELKPGQLPLLMAIVGCAVLLIGVATEALRTRRQEMDQVVQALRTRSAELARPANRMAPLQDHQRRPTGTARSEERRGGEEWVRT